MRRKIGLIELRLSRKDISTGAISTQPRRFGQKLGKMREVRVRAHFVTADVAHPVPHNLGFVPTSWQAMLTSKPLGGAGPAAHIYSDSPIKADRNVICLKSTAANVTADIIVR